jgi:hypothetical protein
MDLKKIEQITLPATIPGSNLPNVLGVQVCNTCHVPALLPMNSDAHTTPSIFCLIFFFFFLASWNFCRRVFQMTAATLSELLCTFFNVAV